MIISAYKDLKKQMAKKKKEDKTQLIQLNSGQMG